jgi:hypothetical protein
MSRSQTIPLELSEHPTLELSANAMDLELIALTPGELPSIEAHGGRSAAASVTVRQDGEVTRVELPNAWAGLELPHRLTLRVPPAVRAKIVNDAGRVHVAGLAGCDLELSSHAGSMTLDDVRGRMKIVVDSGSVKGEQLGGTFDIRSMAGSVKLGIVALDAGNHLVRTAMGAVKVELAAGLQVRVETSATLGSARSNYPSTADAPAVLRLEAELGSVKVRQVDPSADERHGDWPDWRRTWQDVSRVVASTLAAVDDELAPRPKPREAPAEEVRRVLELVQEGALSVPDAERLLRAMR